MKNCSPGAVRMRNFTNCSCRKSRPTNPNAYEPLPAARCRLPASMIKSMTGFASLTHEDEPATIGITMRAVNHRFLDCQLRIPQSLPQVEPRVRTLVQKRLARGRVELQISVQLRTPAAPSVELNEEFANALPAAIDRRPEPGLVAGSLTPGDLLRLPQAISGKDRSTDPDP